MFWSCVWEQVKDEKDAYQEVLDAEQDKSSFSDIRAALMVDFWKL